MSGAAIDLANEVRQSLAETAAKVRDRIAAMPDAELLAWVVQLESPTAELRAERASRHQAREPFISEAPSQDGKEEVAKGASRPQDRVLVALRRRPASLEQLRELTGLDRRQVQNCLQHLKRAGRVRPPGSRGGDWSST